MAINDDDFPVDEAPATNQAPATADESQAAEVTEAPATTEQTVEAPAELTDEQKAEAAKADEAAKAEAKAKADAEYNELMGAYQALVNEVVNSEDIDRQTGDVPDGHKANVRLAYSKLPGIKGKKAGKDWLQEQMHVFMEKFDPTDPETAKFAVTARSFLNLHKEIGKGAVKSESPVAKPVDPTEAHVARVAAAALSPNLILPPDGVADDWKEQVQAKVQELAPQVGAYRDWLNENKDKTGDDRTEEPEVDEVVKAAAKIALGRGLGATKKARATSAGGTTTSTPYTGTRRDIGKHIAEAFESHPVGTFLTVADIAKFPSSEYGNDHPSSGAVSARLFPKGDGTACTVEGIRGEGPDQGRDKKGGLKFA